MSEAGSARNGYSRSRSRSPQRQKSRSPRRSYSPRSRSASPSRRDRRRSRSPRRSSRNGDDSYSRRDYRSSGGGTGGTGQGRRVYVGNLSYDVKWGQLKDFMRSAGEVVHADVLLMPNGMSKGCGVVEYATSSEAQRAISELSNQSLGGRMVYIREDREQEKGFGNTRGGHGSRGSYSDRPDRSGYGSSERGYGNSGPVAQVTSPQLYVTNLPYSVSWQDLKDLFRNAGNVIRADVNMGFDGRSKGTGIILFESISEAQNAVKQFQGYDWQGRMLEIREDRFASSAGRGSSRGGFSDRGGRGGFASRGGGFSSRGVGDSYNGGGGDLYQRAPPAPVAEPNPFTDNAWGNGEPSATIHVKNLPWSTSNDDLVELFSTIGKVERAEICYEPSGRSKGTGVVQFDGQDAAAISIQKFTGYPYGGRPLGLSFVKYDAPTGEYQQEQRQDSAPAGSYNRYDSYPTGGDSGMEGMPEQPYN